MVPTITFLYYRSLAHSIKFLNFPKLLYTVQDIKITLYSSSGIWHLLFSPFMLYFFSPYSLGGGGLPPPFPLSSNIYLIVWKKCVLSEKVKSIHFIVTNQSYKFHPLQQWPTQNCPLHKAWSYLRVDTFVAAVAAAVRDVLCVFCISSIWQRLST